MIADVPPNCTVVGVPGRVVVAEGRRVEAVDLALVVLAIRKLHRQ